jgi:acyl carrier protein
MRLIDQVKGWAADGESGSAQPSPTTPASPAFANPPVASAKEAPPTPAQRAGATEQHSDAMQRVMAQVWAELLEVDDIGPDDNFFDLGGHSLLAAKAVARFEKLTGVQVDKKRLAFESLAQIARSLPAAGVEPTARPGLAGRLLRVFRKG